MFNVFMWPRTREGPWSYAQHLYNIASQRDIYSSPLPIISPHLSLILLSSLLQNHILLLLAVRSDPVSKNLSNLHPTTIADLNN